MHKTQQSINQELGNCNIAIALVLTLGKQFDYPPGIITFELVN
jgi:hypothetical protein